MIRRVLALCATLSALTCRPAVSQAHPVTAICGAPVAILGADLTTTGVAQVRAALGADANTIQLRESLAEERAQAHGAIPATLLGRYAVSSVILRPLAANAGIRVLLRPYVNGYNAQTYANALLTDGITDAEVIVAAPPAQPALGTTALLSLLRATTTSCRAMNPVRQSMAIREFVLTQQLATIIGSSVAPDLVWRLKGDAVRGTRPMDTLLDNDLASTGTVLSPTLRTRLRAYLLDLKRSHLYDQVAAANPTAGRVSWRQVAIRLHGLHVVHGTILTAGGSHLAVRQRGGIARNGKHGSLPLLRPGDNLNVTVNGLGRATGIAASGPSHRGHTVAGTLVMARMTTIGLATAQGHHSYVLKPTLLVYRNGKRGTLTQIEPGDKVTAQLNAAGLVTRIDATSRRASKREDLATLVSALGVALGGLLLALLLLGRKRRRRVRHARGLRSATRRPAAGGLLVAAAAHSAEGLRKLGKSLAGGQTSKAVLAEIVGTFFLTLAALLSPSPVPVALTLAAFVYALGDVSGCHLNPGVTLGLAAARRLPVATAVLYVLAQAIGALVARLLAPGVRPLPAHFAAGSAMGEFLGFAFLMLIVIAVSDRYVPKSGSGIAIGAALLAGLLTSNGILNPAVAVAMGQLGSAAIWAPLLSGVLFAGLFLLLAPNPSKHEDQQDAGQEDETAAGEPARRSA